MLKESGTLPVGITYLGTVHKSYVLRPQTGRDTAEAYGESQSQTNDIFFSLALLTRRVESLGDIPKEAITLDLILDATQLDIDEMNKGARRLDERLKTFSGESSDSAQPSSNAGTDENRVQPGADPANA